MEYYDEIEHELYEYDTIEDESDSIELSIEDWQDWNSEELLNLWMSIVEYHESWYLLPVMSRTFNQFCEFVFHGLNSEEGRRVEEEDFPPPPPEIQAIKNHPWIKGLDWNYFFSLSYK